MADSLARPPRSGLFLLSALLSAMLPATPLGGQTVTGTTPSGLFYEVSGSGQPVVLIHAFSVDRRMWEPQVAELEGGYRVVRYDLRGHGRSVAPTAAYTGYDDLRELLDVLGISRATLVGSSAGAEVAINFAMEYPERTAGLVLAGPGLGGYTVPPLPWAAPVFEAAAAGDAERAAELWAKTPIMGMRTSMDAGEVVTALVMGNSRLWSFRRTERPLSPPAAGRLAEIASPTLIVVGDEDLPHIRDIAMVLADGITAATLVTIQGAGHFPNLDTPGPFNAALVGFLARLDGGDTRAMSPWP